MTRFRRGGAWLDFGFNFQVHAWTTVSMVTPQHYDSDNRRAYEFQRQSSQQSEKAHVDNVQGEFLDFRWHCTSIETQQPLFPNDAGWVFYNASIMLYPAVPSASINRTIQRKRLLFLAESFSPSRSISSWPCPGGRRHRFRCGY